MSNDSIFLAKDFNFNHYSIKDLDLICNHRLPILTDFPKLVLHIYYGKLDVILDENSEYSESEIISRIVNSINKIQHESSAYGNMILDIIDISEPEFDTKLSIFFQEEVVDFVEKKRLSKKKRLSFM